MTSTRVLVALLTAALISGTLQAADRLPNIVYIMADDLGYAELGCYGQERIETPHIDRLAQQGIRFTQHYTSAPVCAPARCSLMTGKHGGHAIVRNNFAQHPPEYPFGDQFGGQYPLPKGTVTVASMLKEAGYVTGAFGKWGLGQVGTTGDPLQQGCDHFFGYNCQGHAHNLYPRYLVENDKQRWLEGNTRGLTGKQYAPQVIADEMLKFVRANKDRPFFLYYPTVIPHVALQVPEAELAHYKGRWPETPYTGRAYLPNAAPRATYAAMITFLDKQVGRLMTELKTLGLDDNTIVFFTSDNGTTHLGDEVDYTFFKSVGPLRGLKGSVYEGGIRAPLIVRWPGHIEPDTVTDLISAHYDALATLADIAKVNPPADTDGISYLPTLLGDAGAQKKHAYLFWDFAGYGGQLAVRMGRWKGVKGNLRKNPDAPLQLYDLQTDIGEQQNVAEQHPKVAQEIDQIMLDARTKPPVKQFRAGHYRSGGAAKWVSIFNGKNLDGWVVKCRPSDRDKTGYWKVVAGTITAETPPGSKHHYIWLLTKKEYGDFALRLKVQTYAATTGNSGIQVRSRYDDAAGWLDGPQVDIHPPGPWRCGFIYDETRGAQVWLWPDVGRAANAKPEHAPAGWKWFHADAKDLWNDVQVVCQGYRIRTVVNRVTIADYDGTGRLDDAAHRKRNVGRKGHIGLQIHPGNELLIRLKDIEIRELD